MLLGTGVAARQKWGFLRKGAQTGACGGAFELKRLDGVRGLESYFRRGPRANAARCDPAEKCECRDATRPLAGGGVRGTLKRCGATGRNEDAWVGFAKLELASR